MSTTGSTPEWVTSQRRARNECEDGCGQQAQTCWQSENGPRICWDCCAKRQAKAAERFAS
jgi:hypothetical protein